MTSDSVIGCGYVIATGSDVDSAVALACDRAGIERMHLLFVVLQATALAVLCAIGFFVGSEAIQGVVDAIPAFVTDGLNYAMGIIPAIGFAMLARMIVDKRTACFLFLGFLLVAYGGMNLVGVAAMASVLAAILVLNVGVGGRAPLRSETAGSGQVGQVAAVSDDDDNEF